MAVTDCQPTKWSGSIGYRGLRLGGQVRVTWKVKTDAQQGPMSTLVQAQAVTSPMTPIPALRSSYSVYGDSEQYLYLNDIAFRKPADTSQLAWYFDCDYKTLEPGQTSAHYNTAPLSRPVRYRIETEHYNEPVTQAILRQDIPNPSFLGAGNLRNAGDQGPLQNSFGDDYDETIQKPRQRVLIVATKPMDNLDDIAGLISDYEDSVNNATWFGVPAYAAQFRGIELGPEIEEYGVKYWNVAFRVAVSYTDWWERIVNRGWRYWTEEDGYASPETVTNAAPVLLKADGLKLEDGKIGNTIAYQTQLKTLDYLGLGIGGSDPTI